MRSFASLRVAVRRGGGGGERRRLQLQDFQDFHLQDSLDFR